MRTLLLTFLKECDVSKGVMAPLYSRGVAWFTTNPGVISSWTKIKERPPDGLTVISSFFAILATLTKARILNLKINQRKVGPDHLPFRFQIFPESLNSESLSDKVRSCEGQSPTWTQVTTLSLASANFHNIIIIIWDVKGDLISTGPNLTLKEKKFKFATKQGNFLLNLRKGHLLCDFTKRSDFSCDNFVTKT